MSKQKIPILFYLLVALVLLLAVMPAGAQEKTTITWLTSQGANVDLPAIIAEFEKAYPDIHVEIENLNFEPFFTAVQVRLGSASPTPDIVSVDAPTVAGYGLRGWLLPLDDAFSDAEKADWLDAAVAASTYNGQLLTAPLSTSTQLLFYNKDLLEAAGITPPGVDDRLTYEQIAEMVPKLVQDTDGDGTTDIWAFNWEQTARFYQLQPLPMSKGSPVIGDDGLTVEGIINDQGWVDAFTYYQNMFTQLKGAPQEDTVGASELFIGGKMAMLLGGPWNINSLINADPDFEWGVSRHPYFEGGEIVTPTGSWHVGINKNTPHPEASKTFLHWLTTGAGAAFRWDHSGRGLSANRSVLALFETDPQYAELPYSLNRVGAQEADVNPQQRPVTPGYVEYEQILNDAFNDIRNGVDVKESLDNAAIRITSEMDKYRQ